MAYNTPTASGNSNLSAPGIFRNSLNGPGYKALDMTLLKAFGLPNLPVLGENAKIEFRADAYNLLNNLNLRGFGQNWEGGKIVDRIENPNFGKSTEAYGGRVVTLGARFNF